MIGSFLTSIRIPANILLLLFVVLYFPASPEDGTTQEVKIDVLRAHTGFLAHDFLEGRGTASRGEALAALYLASQLREYGLKPVVGQVPSG